MLCSVCESVFGQNGKEKKTKLKLGICGGTHAPGISNFIATVCAMMSESNFPRFRLFGILLGILVRYAHKYNPILLCGCRCYCCSMVVCLCVQIYNDKYKKTTTKAHSTILYSMRRRREAHTRLSVCCNHFYSFSTLIIIL